MKQLLYKISLVLILSGFVSCREQCFDIPALDAYNEQIKQWIIDDNIVNPTFKDAYGFEETMIINKVYHEHEDTFEDDCHNIYGSFDSFVSNRLSVTPFNVTIQINGGAEFEYSFIMKLLFSYTDYYKEITYNFYTKEISGNSQVTELPSFQVGTTVYNNVLRFDFHNLGSTLKIKTLYYAQHYGIVKIEFENGNYFEIQ